MPNVYVCSYYQLSKWPCQSFDEDARKVVDTIITQDGALRVSKANLMLATHAAHAQRWHSAQADYLNALWCDLEVAIQEKKLRDMSEKFEFNFVLRSDFFRPRLVYLEEFSTTDIVLSEEEKISTDVYVINSHGKPGQLDGSYQPAIDHPSPLGRIVVDACSSALPQYSSSRHQRSIIEQLANNIVNSEESNALEIVGYNHDYSTEETNLTAHAVFACKKLVERQNGLKLIIVGQEKQLRLNEELLLRDSATKRKLMFFDQTCTGSDDAHHNVHRLRAMLNIFHSKIASHYVTQENLIHNAHDSIIELILETLEHNDNIRQLISSIKQEGLVPGLAKKIAAIKKELKEQRQNDLSTVDGVTLLYLAQKALDVVGEIENDLDFNSSRAALKFSIEALQTQLKPKANGMDSSHLLNESNNFISAQEAYLGR